MSLFPDSSQAGTKDVSPEEMTNALNAIKKNPEMMQLLHEYVQSLQEPGALAEREAELRRLEELNSLPSDVFLMRPKEFMCLRANTKSGGHMYINITYSTEVDPAEFKSGSGGTSVSLPRVVGELRNETDPFSKDTDQKVPVVEVCVHSDVIARCLGKGPAKKQLLDFVCDSALEMADFRLMQLDEKIGAKKKKKTNSKYSELTGKFSIVKEVKKICAVGEFPAINIASMVAARGSSANKTASKVEKQTPNKAVKQESKAKTAASGEKSDTPAPVVAAPAAKSASVVKKSEFFAQLGKKLVSHGGLYTSPNKKSKAPSSTDGSKHTEATSTEHATANASANASKRLIEELSTMDELKEDHGNVDNEGGVAFGSSSFSEPQKRNEEGILLHPPADIQIIHSNRFDISQHTRYDPVAASGVTSNRPSALTLRISLPGVARASELDVAIADCNKKLILQSLKTYEPDSISVSTSTESQGPTAARGKKRWTLPSESFIYYAEVPLPYEIHADQVAGKWDKAKKVLTSILPVVQLPVTSVTSGSGGPLLDVPASISPDILLQDSGLETERQNAKAEGTEVDEVGPMETKNNSNKLIEEVKPEELAQKHSRWVEQRLEPSNAQSLPSDVTSWLKKYDEAKKAKEQEEKELLEKVVKEKENQGNTQVDEGKEHQSEEFEEKLSVPSGAVAEGKNPAVNMPFKSIVSGNITNLMYPSEDVLCPPFRWNQTPSCVSIIVDVRAIAPETIELMWLSEHIAYEKQGRDSAEFASQFGKPVIDTLDASDSDATAMGIVFSFLAPATSNVASESHSTGRASESPTQQSLTKYQFSLHFPHPVHPFHQFTRVSSSDLNLAIVFTKAKLGKGAFTQDNEDTKGANEMDKVPGKNAGFPIWEAIQRASVEEGRFNGLPVDWKPEQVESAPVPNVQEVVEYEYYDVETEGEVEYEDTIFVDVEEEPEVFELGTDGSFDLTSCSIKKKVEKKVKKKKIVKTTRREKRPVVRLVPINSKIPEPVREEQNVSDVSSKDINQERDDDLEDLAALLYQLD